MYRNMLINDATDRSALTLGMIGGTAVRLRNPSQSNPWNHLHGIWGPEDLEGVEWGEVHSGVGWGGVNTVGLIQWDGVG